jgi:hypothetical protein
MVSFGRRQGEGTPILTWMADLGLQSLLPQGTTTYEHRGRETTIDLALVSHEMRAAVLKCGIHELELGSDHRAIRTIFSADVSIRERPRYFAPDATPFGNIPVLVDGTTEIHEDQEKGDLLLRTFFPATPAIHPNTESEQAPRGQLADDPPLTVAEVGDAVERIRPWSAGCG